jgi:MFS family permease
MGLFYTGYYLGMALLPPVAGWLQDLFGRSAALYFAAAAVLAALPFYVAFRAMSKAREGPIPGVDRAQQA